MKRLKKEYINYQTIFWLFIIGSVAGFLVEGIHAVFRRGAWENHSATVWGPFCIIYGIGAVALYLVSLLLKERSAPEQFLMFALSGTAVEYAGSWLQERVFGSRSWDYSQKFLNIRGRVCLEKTLVWGILGLGFAKLALPLVMKLLEAMRSNPWRIGCAVLTVFMAANLLLSAAAVLRWRDRRNGLAPKNRVEAFIDERYGEDVMERVYGNMRFE